jgi:UDP-N-acetylmuramoyl-tripeptide--D-alanyl-D-alanine ligase
MKNFIKKIIILKLGFCARILLARKKPEIIAITGSAGKTSTKEFLSKLLSVDFEVLATQEGYNTDIGAPLSLFGEKVPNNLFNIFHWIIILSKCFFKAFFMKDLPDKIVVEMGADKPGDIKYLCSIFKPNKAVILPVHMAEFKSIDEIAKEKSQLAKAIPENGKLFLNFDDIKVRDMAKLTKGNVVFFGLTDNGCYQAKEVKSDLTGLKFELKYYNQKEKFQARIYGKHIIYAILAAIAVAAEENISMSEIKDAVARLEPFKGRMNVIEGIKGSIIIDDSYNANPQSVLEALEFLDSVPGRKIAILGNMNELGDYEKEGHERVGHKAGKVADIILTIGPATKKYLIPAALNEKIKKDSILSFENAEKAGDWLRKKLREGDVVLAKGSQNNVRVEKAVEKIMAHPEKKGEILVRQSEFWKKEV